MARFDIEMFALVTLFAACGNAPAVGFLSYSFDPGADDGVPTIDACRLAGPYSHVAVVEVTGPSTRVEPPCPMPKIRKAYRDWPVSTLRTISGSPPASFVAASGLMGDFSLPKTEVGERYLLAMRHHDDMWLISDWAKVQFVPNPQVARLSTTGRVDLPHDVSSLKREIAVNHQTPCENLNPFLWIDDHEFRRISEDDSYCENTGIIVDRDAGAADPYIYPDMDVPP